MKSYSSSYFACGLYMFYTVLTSHVDALLCFPSYKFRYDTFDNQPQNSIEALRDLFDDACETDVKNNNWSPTCEPVCKMAISTSYITTKRHEMKIYDESILDRENYARLVRAKIEPNDGKRSTRAGYNKLECHFNNGDSGKHCDGLYSWEFDPSDDALKDMRLNGELDNTLISTFSDNGNGQERRESEQKTCAAGKAVVFIQVGNNWGSRVYFRCRSPSLGYTLGPNTEWIEKTSERLMSCPTNHIITGLWCTGDNCDSPHIRCAKVIKLDYEEDKNMMIGFETASPVLDTCEWRPIANKNTISACAEYCYNNNLESDQCKAFIFDSGKSSKCHMQETLRDSSFHGPVSCTHFTGEARYYRAKPALRRRNELIAPCLNYAMQVNNNNQVNKCENFQDICSDYSKAIYSRVMRSINNGRELYNCGNTFDDWRDNFQVDHSNLFEKKKSLTLFDYESSFLDKNDMKTYENKTEAYWFYWAAKTERWSDVDRLLNEYTNMCVAPDFNYADMSPLMLAVLFKAPVSTIENLLDAGVTTTSKSSVEYLNISEYHEKNALQILNTRWPGSDFQRAVSTLLNDHEKKTSAKCALCNPEECCACYMTYFDWVYFNFNKQITSEQQKNDLNNIVAFSSENLLLKSAASWFLLAAKNNKWDEVEYIVNTFYSGDIPDVSIDHKNTPELHTVLQYAVIDENVNMIQFLLTNGASYEVKGPDGSALDIATANPEIKMLLLQWKPPCDPLKNDDDCTVTFFDWFRYKFNRFTTDDDRVVSMNTNANVKDDASGDIDNDDFRLGNILTVTIKYKKWSDAQKILDNYYSGLLQGTKVDGDEDTGRPTVLHLIATYVTDELFDKETGIRHLTNTTLLLGASRERVLDGKNAIQIAQDNNNLKIANFIKQWEPPKPAAKKPVSTGIIVGAVFGGLFIVIVGVQFVLNKN